MAFFSEISDLLNRQVTLRSNGTSPMDDGSIQITPYDKITFSASVQPLTGDKVVLDGQGVMLANTRFICLVDLNVADGDVLVDDLDVTYDVYYSDKVLSANGDYSFALAKRRKG